MTNSILIDYLIRNVLRKNYFVSYLLLLAMNKC